MKREFALTQKDFDALLGWLAVDREEAGRRYERIRDGLIRFFRYRGCGEPDTLADETINRVAGKAASFDFPAEADTIKFFYGYASKIYMERMTKPETREVPLDDEVFFDENKENLLAELKRDECDCLKKCLARLSAEENKLVVGYYSREKEAKFELRRTMAAELNLKPNALYIRVHRIRNVLKICIENCLKRK